MTSVRVFDPAMCCSTGVCGTSVDPQLVRFAADLEWLKSRGVSIEPFGLSQKPGDHADRIVLEPWRDGWSTNDIRTPSTRPMFPADGLRS